jgi:uncharacterized membrane protein
MRRVMLATAVGAAFVVLSGTAPLAVADRDDDQDKGSHAIQLGPRPCAGGVAFNLAGRAHEQTCFNRSGHR